MAFDFWMLDDYVILKIIFSLFLLFRIFTNIIFLNSFEIMKRIILFLFQVKVYSNDQTMDGYWIRISLWAKIRFFFLMEIKCEIP